MRGEELVGVRRVHFLLRAHASTSDPFPITERGDWLILRVDDRDHRGEVGDVEVPGVLVKAAWVAGEVALDRALVFQLERIDLIPRIGAVGDEHLGLAVQRADPDAVAGVEGVVACAFPAESFDVLEVPVEPADALAAVAIDDVDVPVGRDGDIGGIRPVELLMRGVLRLHIANGVEHLALHIGLIHALADGLAVLPLACVFGEVEELAVLLLAPVDAVRGACDFAGGEAHAGGELIAPCLLQLPIGAEDRDARTGRARGDDDAVLRVHHDAATEAELHPLGQLAPALVERVGPLAAADFHRDLVLRAGEGWDGERGAGGEFQEVAAGEAMGEEVFVVHGGKVDGVDAKTGAGSPRRFGVRLVT